MKTAEVEWKDGAPIHIRPATPGDGYVCCLECGGWSWKQHVMGGLVPCESPRCVGGLVSVEDL
jgi:hypothetical protein